MCSKVLFRENFIAKKYKKFRKPEEWDKHSTLKGKDKENVTNMMTSISAYMED